MNHYEMAEYLMSKGYKVFSDEKGIEFESFLLGLNTTPIDYEKLYKVAEQEGYEYHSRYGWVEKEFAEKYIKKVKKEIV